MKTPYRSLVWGVCGTVLIAAVANVSQAQQEAVYRHVQANGGHVVLKVMVPADRQSLEGIVIDVSDYETDGWLVGQTVLTGQAMPDGIFGNMDLYHVDLATTWMQTSAAEIRMTDWGFYADPNSMGAFAPRYYRVSLEPNNFVDVNATLEGQWRLRGGDDRTIVELEAGSRLYNWQARIVQCSVADFVGKHLFELNAVGTGIYFGRYQPVTFFGADVSPYGDWYMVENAAVGQDGALYVIVQGPAGSTTYVFDRLTPVAQQAEARLQGQWTFRPELASLNVFAENGQFTATLEWSSVMTVQIAGTYTNDLYTFEWTAFMIEGEQFRGAGTAALSADGGTLNGQIWVTGNAEPQTFSWRIVDRVIYTRQYY